MGATWEWSQEHFKAVAEGWEVAGEQHPVIQQRFTEILCCQDNIAQWGGRYQDWKYTNEDMQAVAVFAPLYCCITFTWNI